MAQQSIEYGKRSGPHHSVYPFPIGASEVFKKKGGSFVKDDGSGRMEIATAAATNLAGYALFNEDFTASSTEGATTLPVDISYDSVYEIPISGTWADTMRGKTCDIIITSSIQYANVDASATDVLILVDKGTTNAAGTVVSVLCRLNPNTQSLSGVA